MSAVPPSPSSSTAAAPSTARPTAPLQRTPLHALHVELGAKMVPFAGYDMPVSYPQGILAEHHHCRRSAALFDVSHMGQLRLVGDDAAAALESLVPMDIVDLAVGRQRYVLLTHDGGGILDDAMVARRKDDLFVVVNAACKDADTKHLMTHIGHRCTVVPMPERALLAVQGPLAVDACARLAPELAALKFMDTTIVTMAGARCDVSRSGYTGEDGFEISVPAEHAVTLAKALLQQPEVKPAGLGARDTLRLEAGLCLYGHDIDDKTTPVEAALTWAIQKVRRPGGARAGNLRGHHYPGHAAIEAELERGASIKRVGFVGLERMPVREGAALTDAMGHHLGRVTSGTLSPTLGKPIAMGYVALNHAQPGAEIRADVRGKPQPMRVAPMPFVPAGYKR
jgi:aminomethyltransferase